MGSAQSRNERRRASSSIDNERPAARRRLDPLRRLSTLGRDTAKRDRGQSIEAEGEEREKRQRTGSSSPGIDNAGESSGGPRSEEEEDQDPLALERTQSIDTIRQVLGNDWTPPWPRSNTSPDAGTDTTAPSAAILHISAPTPTPASSTAAGPPVHNPSTIQIFGGPGPASAAPLAENATTSLLRPSFLPTPNLQRRWSTGFTLQPPIVRDSDTLIPLTRTQSELPPLRLRSEERGIIHYPTYYRNEVSAHLRILSNQRLDMRERFNRIRAALDRSDPQAAAQEAEAARVALGLPRSPAEAAGDAGEGGAGGRGSGAMLMIQGLAQMQNPPPPDTTPRRRFGRRNNAIREHVSEQANMIANLLT